MTPRSRSLALSLGVSSPPPSLPLPGTREGLPGKWGPPWEKKGQCSQLCHGPLCLITATHDMTDGVFGTTLAIVHSGTAVCRAGCCGVMSRARVISSTWPARQSGWFPGRFWVEPSVSIGACQGRDMAGGLTVKEVKRDTVS